MISWFRRRAYANDIMIRLQVMMLTGRFIRNHRGVQAAVRDNFDKGIPAPITTIHIASSLIADAIEQSGDTARKQMIAQQLDAWSTTENPRLFKKQLREGTLDQDMLLTQCQWMLVVGQDMLLAGEITVHDFRILKDSIYGSLKGEPKEQRTADRVSSMLEEILGPEPD
ncbi:MULTISPECIES: hypothetical protein [unclassified Sinorhizobium]|uniref:hypothetical protein n=1 Tax=unclassified Sinorhizobium TaxID=2613772 RepID=UPI003523FB29